MFFDQRVKCFLIISETHSESPPVSGQVFGVDVCIIQGLLHEGIGETEEPLWAQFDLVVIFFEILW